MTEIYLKDSWTNPSYDSMFNKEILEYDIESAGLNLSIKYNLLSEDTCEKLKELDKSKRVIKLGLLQKEDADFNRKLKEAFRDIRRVFFESNELDLQDIVSIKKDAIFVLKECSITKFDNVVFRVKNIYTSYIHLGRLEFYYNPDKIDVKGLGENDRKYHEDFIIKMIRGYIRIRENEPKEQGLKYIMRYIDDYKTFSLPVEFYKEFRSGGLYQLIDNPDQIPYLDFPEERKDELDVMYNFLEVFTKLALLSL